VNESEQLVVGKWSEEEKKIIFNHDKIVGGELFTPMHLPTFANCKRTLIPHSHSRHSSSHSRHCISSRRQSRRAKSTMGRTLPNA